MRARSKATASTPGIAHLAAEERLALVDNLWALARHGKATLATFLAPLETLRGEEDRAVLAAIADSLSWLGNYAVRDATERPFARLVDDLYRPILDAAGWTARGRRRHRRA